MSRIIETIQIAFVLLAMILAWSFEAQAYIMIDPKKDSNWIFGISCEPAMILINTNHPEVINGLSEQEWLHGYRNAVDAYNAHCSGGIET